MGPKACVAPYPGVYKQDVRRSDGEGEENTINSPKQHTPNDSAIPLLHKSIDLFTQQAKLYAEIFLYVRKSLRFDLYLTYTHSYEDISINIFNIRCERRCLKSSSLLHLIRLCKLVQSQTHRQNEKV